MFPHVKGQFEDLPSKSSLNRNRLIHLCQDAKGEFSGVNKNGHQAKQYTIIFGKSLEVTRHLHS